MIFEQKIRQGNFGLVLFFNNRVFSTGLLFRLASLNEQYGEKTGEDRDSIKLIVF